ncbi:MAG: 4Fe-4S binding protein [Candidatus Omnitrophica bacterium]|nr:4Fe-4S binding protein [Candidatus Omnitrophota bacterium]
MPAIVDVEKCNGCQQCVEVCSVQAIVIENDKAKITPECIDCAACVSVCPNEAISME